MPTNNNLPVKIPKQPVLKAAEDYYLLRREGIGFIEKMGSGLWTDYNTHDPGITILETLCYTITDLAHRIGWDIKDILSPEEVPSNQLQPYTDQPFFTAKKILTVNPTTIIDFRRCLIDLLAVRNSWVFPRECACEVSYYAECENNALKLSYEPPDNITKPVWPRGLYDVLLELEVDAEAGDLNDFKIEYRAMITETGSSHEVVLELRFPKTLIEDISEWADSIVGVQLKRLGTTKTDIDVLTDQSLSSRKKRNEYLRRHWYNVMYLDFEVTYSTDPSVKPFTIQNVAMRIFSDAEAKNGDITTFFTDFFDPPACEAIVDRYLDKVRKREAAVDSAEQRLHRLRNLDEDYCNIKVIDIEEVAACADIEVKPNADIELVQAKIFFEIEQYFNPPVQFYTLEELLDSGEAVESIFNGPKLDNGFIKNSDLEAASFKSELYVSDIINKLMDIEGVVAVNNLQLTKYDSEGNVVTGAADPDVEGYDKNKISASWQLSLSSRHRPRLYLGGSRFVFYKNGFPFYPDKDEVNDIITLLRGEVERPKIKTDSETSGDLPAPLGTFRNLEEYYPIQHSFPLTYGIGPDGLPPQASDRRKAQAMQLKAYLMVFEQIIGNACAQLAHTKDLFSLDPDVENTYFVQKFNDDIIDNYKLIVDNSLDKSTLAAMPETKLEFRERRNRFLDHVMARFGEQFDEYTFLLTNLQGKMVALDNLIDDKIDFLNAYPEISSDRARAFDYSDLPYSLDNQPGLKKRVKRLLGQPRIDFKWISLTDLGTKIRLKFQLIERGSSIFTGYVRVLDIDRDEAGLRARQAVIARMSLEENYTITKEAVITSAPDKFILRLKRTAGQAHGSFDQEFDTQAEAESMRDTMITWAAFERMVILEHLLLRPKFPGDALYPGCCDDEDPYSFRLTFIILGGIEPFRTNMEMRDFVDRTIRQETPSHLVVKICWVENTEFDTLEDAWFEWLNVNKRVDWMEERLQERVESILYNNLKPDDTAESAKDKVSNCASDILIQWGKAFHSWMNANVIDEQHLESHRALEGFSVPTVSCLGAFKPDAAVQIEELLRKRYKEYIQVSYRLRTMVTLLSELKNIYPAATLHDWVEGDDRNPIRLGKTALGS
jgi:hypothetical protein